MTKYSPEFKAQIVHEHFINSIGSRTLGRKYNVDSREIRRWIQRYHAQGISAFKNRRTKRSFTADFKLNVIDYYQTHEASMTDVAFQFDLLPSQVSSWCSQFKRDGIEALKPHQKGRPIKVKYTKKQLRYLNNKTEIERLKEELAKKNAELYDTKLERDILKKSLSLFGPSKPEKRHK